MSFSLLEKADNIQAGQFSIFPQKGLEHAISTRFGGVSQAPFDKMNLAMHNGDDKKSVLENRKRFCNAFFLSSANLCTCEQVHSSNIMQVTAVDAGRGAISYEDAIKATDALITNVKNVPLMLFFADCTPILFFDPEHQAIGISHAGWKGTVHKIAQKTVQAMQSAFQTDPKNCLVGIGPSIGPCCYEVGVDVQLQFRKAFPNDVNTILIPFQEKWKLDLWAANRIQLEEVGISKENIDMAHTCTACNSDVFFSYRADQGKTGRIAAMLCLK